MKNLSQKKRLVENEVIFRDVNSNISEFLKESGRAHERAPYYCECSRPKCIDRINLTPKEYQAAHKNDKMFILLSGHEFSEVEKVIKKTSRYQIVEKHFKPPMASELSLGLRSISNRI